jgi:hypothetical protein
MKEPKQSVDPKSPAQGRGNAWWRVRPMLRAILLLEMVAGVGLYVADQTSAALMRAWIRPIPVVWENVQAVLTALAILAVIAVMIEALRRGRLSSRRNDGGLKVASATSA